MCNFDDRKVNQIISDYEYLISIILSTFVIKKADYEDAFQEGRIGLFKAILAFRDNGGAEFVTFASICIKRQIISFLRKHGKNYYNNILVQLEDYDSEAYSRKYYVNDIEHFVYTKNKYLNAIRRVYAEITPTDKHVYGHYLYGYSISELSETYELPKKNIYMIIARTKKKIESKMNE